MRARLVIAALASLFAGTSSAFAADPMTMTFRDLCLTGGADADAALAAGQKAGWMALPAALLTKFSENPQFSNARGLLRSTQDSMEILLVSHAAATPLPFEADICAVMFIGAKPKLDADAAELAGVPISNLGGRMAYIWREENGAHAPLDMGNISRDRKLLEDSSLRFLMLQQDDAKSILMLMVPRKPDFQIVPNPQ